MEGVTKNPKKIRSREERYQARLLKLKDKILAKDGTTATNAGSNSGSTSTNPGSNSGSTATTLVVTLVPLLLTLAHSV